MDEHELRDGSESAAHHQHGGRWVIGVDGSECSRHAALWAAAQAKGRARELQLVATWSIPASTAMTPMSSLTTSASFDALQESAQATVDQLAQRIAPSIGVPVTRTVSQGSAATLLLDAARNSELLVVGSRGHGGFARLVLGSTSTHCATHSSAPVAVIPSTSPIDSVVSIVVAFDASENSIAALTWANRFAAPGSTIECVSVWDSTPIAVNTDQIVFPEASDIVEERVEHLVGQTIRPIRRDDIEVRHRFIEGQPRMVLAEFAASCDLLVVGARGHGAIGSAVLGSVSTWLLHHAVRPVVVVPHAPEGHDAKPSERDG